MRLCRYGSLGVASERAAGYEPRSLNRPQTVRQRTRFSQKLIRYPVDRASGVCAPCAWYVPLDSSAELPRAEGRFAVQPSARFHPKAPRGRSKGKPSMTSSKIPVQQNPAEPDSFPAVRTRRIRTDDFGRVCLNDIWEAAGATPDRHPLEWHRSVPTKRLARWLTQLIEESSHHSPAPVIVCAKGQKAATFAHPVLALVFAEFVEGRLAVEVREVFLRHKLADPTLADEILERASPEANEWAGQRALVRAGRHAFTDVLKGHGVTGKDYGVCTDTLYLSLFDKRAKALKLERGLPVNSSLRDAMSTLELASIAIGEALASERIEEENSDGGEQCRRAMSRSAGFLRWAIEADRRDRRGQTPLAANDTCKKASAA